MCSRAAFVPGFRFLFASKSKFTSPRLFPENVFSHSVLAMYAFDLFQLKKTEMGQASAADLEAQQQMQLMAMQHALGQQMLVRT